MRGSKKRVMVLLMSLIKCYSLCNESASFDRPKKQKKKKKGERDLFRIRG